MRGMILICAGIGNRGHREGNRGQVLQSNNSSAMVKLWQDLLRIELAGGLYHVTSRGDRREDIFLCEGDRYLWLEIFGDVCQRFNWT